MNETRAPDTIQISRRYSVETPEHVLLEFELAGVGSRAAAAVIDAVILVILLIVFAIFFFSLASAAGSAGGWVLAVFVGINFLVFWGYYVVFEALGQGRTPGKRALGIRVVMDTGHPLTPQAAAIRNLLRLIDGQPAFLYGVGLVFSFFGRDHKRLGDLVAGTIVVRDRPDDFLVAIPLAADEVLDAGPPQLADEEFDLIERFINRMPALDRTTRLRFAAQLAERFAERFPGRESVPETFLVQLYSDELTRRQSRTATRTAGSAGRAPGSGRRFVALRSSAWEEFRQRALRVEKKGLTRLSGSEIKEFAGGYREVAADLARGRTYGVDARVIEYLERIVSSGHNALYGVRGIRRTSIIRLVLRELPADVFRCRYYVLTAFLLFCIPAIAGYAVIRESPEVAYDVLPHVMIERAEYGRFEQKEGIGYAQTPSPYLPLMATSIIANNVQVAFGAFAFGITAGIGTVFVLTLNGLHFGSVLALFANYGLAGWLLTFVLAHGPLELTAIFIAGGAGLLIGRALIAPGDLTRKDSLIVHGRTALRLLAAAASLLLLAGIIEGFLSASDAPLKFKLGVSAASVLLLGLYLLSGGISNKERQKIDWNRRFTKGA